MSTSFFWGEGGCACSMDTCEGCSTYEAHKPNPLTNADRIRAMTDEELAEMFLAHDEQYYRHCPSDVIAEYCQVKPGVESCDCKDCWLDWLRQEAEE